MNKKIALTVVFIVVVVVVGIPTFKKYRAPEQVACTLEAKMCPDGSYVGRQGPQCEFAACPTISQSNKAKINKSIVINDIYITPVKVNSDSRCPVDVQCIWEGTVSLKVRLQANGTAEEKNIELNKSISFGGKTVKLVSVSPATHSKQTISESQYELEFSVE